jgi:predicted AAA+ superfamily ATPase
MLEHGHDSYHLRILAGESPPYNQLELLEIVDNTFEELGLDWSNTECTVNNCVVELLEETVAGRKKSQFVLRMLKDMCIELDYAECLYDF